MLAAFVSFAVQDRAFVPTTLSDFTLPAVPATDDPGVHPQVGRPPVGGARGLRDAGVALTVVGGLGLVVSTVFGVAEIVASSSCKATGCMAEPYLGSIARVTAGVSAPLAIAGGSMWGLGQRRLNRPRVEMSLRVHACPGGGGGGVDLVF